MPFFQLPRLEMSAHIAPENLCYVHCNFCNSILAVNVPGNNLFHVVTVRCGHCANLLSVTVNMGGSLQTIPPPDFQKEKFQIPNIGSHGIRMENGSSSRFNRSSFMYPTQNDQQQMLPIRPPEKRQRVPSAYNRFIKEEIQRIKASKPDISHREAFSAAAKNWAHFPHIHFGLSLDSNKQARLDEAIASPGGQKARNFY